MSEWVSIQYWDFWNVPRIFVTSYQGHTLLFDCPLDGETEDFPDSYNVYVLPLLGPEELDGSWEELHTRAIASLWQVAISQVRFYPTKRHSVHTALLNELLAEARTA